MQEDRTVTGYYVRPNMPSSVKKGAHIALILLVGFIVFNLYVCRDVPILGLCLSSVQLIAILAILWVLLVLKNQKLWVGEQELTYTTWYGKKSTFLWSELDHIAPGFGVNGHTKEGRKLFWLDLLLKESDPFVADLRKRGVGGL